MVKCLSCRASLALHLCAQEDVGCAQHVPLPLRVAGPWACVMCSDDMSLHIIVVGMTPARG